MAARLCCTRPRPPRHAASLRRLTTSPSSPIPNPAPWGHLPSSESPFTNQLQFFNAVLPHGQQIPTYRILDSIGNPLDPAQLPDIDEPFARRLYEKMTLLPVLDTLLYNVQRQGKISFYHGEEATVVGSAAALRGTDEVMGQYREMGVLLWRGFTLHSVMAQCLGNEEDRGTKGRQMPVHFGSVDHHFHTISSTLATQIPQAAGVGYALKRDPERRSRDCAVCYFGEGAASEGDFHAGLLLASTIPSPTIYIVRNNGFAISTPSSEQYHGDGIAARGPGYGIDTVRVDGNDVLAVLKAVRRLGSDVSSKPSYSSRSYVIQLVRVGHHSTSDDSFAYRAKSEVEHRKKVDNPINRLRLFLEARKWWSAEDEEQLRARHKKEVLEAFKRAEGLKRFELQELFNDVYGGEEPWNLKEQREELGRLMKKYGDVWEPWRKEREKFKGAGKEFL